MDSAIDTVKALIDEGKPFDFSNFCDPQDNYYSERAGANKPEWTTWKARTVNVVKNCHLKNPLLSN